MDLPLEIQSVYETGNAIAKITIKQVRYFARIKDEHILDFDSSRKKDQNSPFAKLIGQSYTIKITSAGEVKEVIDIKKAQAAVRGPSPAHRAASMLLSSDVIKERHTIPALPDAGKKQLRTGDSWSRTKTFSFQMMGSKSYEKIYTIKEIKYIDNRRIAIVEMNGGAGAESAERREQAIAGLLDMFDNTEIYTGRLKLDLTAGKVEKYFEKLSAEWVHVEPPAGQKNVEGPTAVKMSTVRLYSLERID